MMNKYKHNDILKNNHGLTLIEVLISLLLVSILFFSIDISIRSEREDLEESLDALERAVRFSSNESVLRNAIVRIHFELDKTPQEFSIEVGPDGDFVLPLFKDFGDNNRLTLSEQEKRDKLIADINKNFNKISEYKSQNDKLPYNVRIIGIATEQREGILLDGDVSLYFYPSGEKDSSFIALSTSEEVVTIRLSPLGRGLSRSYQTMTAKYDEEIVQQQEDILKEEYENWLRN